MEVQQQCRTLKLRRKISANFIFINRELAQEYIDSHADVIDVIGYDEIVVQSMQEQSAYKRAQEGKKLLT